MKTLHKINPHANIPDWIKSWIWWSQTRWNNEYHIVYNESRVYFKGKIIGTRDMRDQPHDGVLKTWRGAGSPEPNWSEPKYNENVTYNTF